MATRNSGVEQRGPDGFTPSQLRKLKIAVVVMGVILILGFAGLIWRIVYLINKDRPVAGAAATLVRDARLPLPSGAAVKSMALSGNRLAVHYDGPAGAGIAILDLVTGQPVSQIDLAPQVPSR